jgi:hypothetical protein
MNTNVNTYAVLGINSCVKVLTLYHHGQLFVNRLSGGSKSSIQAIESYAREWNKVLYNTLAPNQVVYVINMLLQVDVQIIVGSVCFQDGKTRGVPAVDEEGNGTSNMGFQFQIRSEVRIVKYFAVQLIAFHSGQSTESSVDRDIICADDGIAA